MWGRCFHRGFAWPRGFAGPTGWGMPWAYNQPWFGWRPVIPAGWWTYSFPYLRATAYPWGPWSPYW